MKFISRYGVTKGERIKILTSNINQILQRLPIALAEVGEGNISANIHQNTSEYSLNEIQQTFYFLYQAKEITKTYTII